MKEPKVSIVIPVYNGSNYVKKAIDSALNQTYKNIEIIVVNDGSKDNTESIVKEYGDKVRYFSKENGGVSSALNLAIEKMTGEYFSWLSHDDEFMPNKIEILVKEMNKYNHDTVLYSDFLTIDENSQIIRAHKKNHKMLIEKPEYALLRGAVNGITMLIPKEAFDYAGMFDEKLKCVQDYDMWKKMMEKYKFVHVAEIVAKTRIHDLQDTKVSPNVLTEGNPFWIDMVDYLPDERKIELEGSLYDYYHNLYNYLKKSVYTEASDYAKKKCHDVDPVRYEQDNKICSSKGIKKMYYTIKYRGIKYIFKRLISKCKRIIKIK